MRLILIIFTFLLLGSVGSFANTTTTSTSTVPTFVCTNNADCNIHGTCDTESGKCRCDSGYIDEDCSYEQYKQWIAFTLNFFLGMPLGLGYFYIGDYVVVGLKTALFFGSGILACSFEGCMCNQGQDSTCGKCLIKVPCALGGVMGLFGLAASFGWWLADNIYLVPLKLKTTMENP